MPWSWDPSLYAGSAPHYVLGRVAHPAGVPKALVGALRLDGSQRLLDVGCGPGSLTLLLAPHVAEAFGVDADGDMLAEAARLASERSLPNVRWLRMRAEELPGDLPPVDVTTSAQSFHRMDRPRVAAAVRRMLRPGDALVHVGATTHEGIDPDVDLPFPRPPRDAVAALVRRYLGPVRRAGQGIRPEGTSGGEDERADALDHADHLALTARSDQKGGSSGSGGARGSGGRRPGGRVVRVRPAGLVACRVPSGSMTNRQPRAWVFSRWWCRHRQHRVVQVVRPPAAWARTWSWSAQPTR